MKKLLSIASALLLACAVVPAHADSVTYAVTVNTSSQTGNGYVDFELNAGSLGAQDITATVTGFSGAVLIPGDPMNDAIGTTGSLDAPPLTFDNQIGNDYFEALTFGNQVSFLVTLSGDGVSTSGASTSDSGTIFQVSFWDASGMNPVLSDDPNGLAAEIDVADNGMLSSDAGTGTTVSAAATPEPATLSLVGAAGVLMYVAQRRRRAA